jgi:16S rRNA (guanine966-N2)-methyltransferase
MRIVAGKFRSRILAPVKDLALRPTSDRLRETLFDILGERVEGAVFWDLFAGTGAVGIEALSRGARRVVFVEKHAATVRLIRRNLEMLKVREGKNEEVEIICADAVAAVAKLGEHGVKADFIFADPPYARQKELEETLGVIAERSLLAPAGIFVAEHSVKFALPEVMETLKKIRVVEQGDSALSFYGGQSQSR